MSLHKIEGLFLKIQQIQQTLNFSDKANYAAHQADLFEANQQYQEFLEKNESAFEDIKQQVEQFSSLPINDIPMSDNPMQL